MKAIVACLENNGYKREVEVYAVRFDARSRVFNMWLCWGDMWDIELKCPLPITPTNVVSSEDKISVEFELQNDAESFVAWLIEAEAKVQHGFDTMRD